MPTPKTDDLLEREKWEAEKTFREQEIELKKQEIELKKREQENEQELKQRQHALAQWTSPVIVAIVAAFFAAAGSVWVSYHNGESAREIEAIRSDQARILEMIKTDSPDKAAVNLDFLVAAGLINDPETSRNLKAFLSARKKGSGPSLPAAPLNMSTSDISEALRTHGLDPKVIVQMLRFQEVAPDRPKSQK